MKTKKTQQEIIVTVLLVLIAIAAVILISNFVINMVKERAGAGESQIKCLSLAFTINKAIAATAGANVTITRNAGGDNVEIIGAKILVEGTIKGNYTGNWSTFETKEIGLNTPKLTVGEKVGIAILLKGGATCDPKDTYAATAA